jgi:hypothetical protein
MKCYKYPLSEIKNKIIAIECEELKNNTINICVLKSFKIDENLSNLKFTFYHQIILNSNNYVLSHKNVKNQFFILENDIIVIMKQIYKINAYNVIKLSVVKLLSMSNLFKLPVPSKLVGVFFT